MTIKLKQMRGQPLLAPPGEGEWWVMSHHDVELMRQYLAESRKKRLGFAIAQMHHSMRILDCPDPITIEDRAIMVGGAIGRRKDNPSLVLPSFYDMWRIGVKEPVPQEDVDYARKDLEVNRKANKGHNTSSLINDLRGVGIHEPITRRDLRSFMVYLKSERKEPGFSAPGHYLILKELGLERLLTPAESDVMRRILAEYRRADSGEGVAMTHHQMRQLGFEEPMTDVDWDMIRHDLNRYRREDKGELVADMHIYLKSLMPGEDTRQMPVPPLKNFGK